MDIVPGEGTWVRTIADPPALAEIERAAVLIREVAIQTPALLSEPLGRALGAPLHVKLECLQTTGSFKIRGAFAKLSSLTEDERRRGVICASAGNHGQGVALSARRLGVPATVVMPEEASYTKVKAIRGHGAEVVRHGSSYDEAYRRARALCEEKGLTFVHPFDDPKVIAGQGTVGLEVVRAVPDVGTIVCPIGGGGLISGIAIAAKALRPEVRVVGVVAAAARATLDSFKHGQRVEGPVGDTIADGIRVKRPGEITFPVIRDKVDDVVDVTEDEIGHAIYALLQAHHVAAEGAGAAALAACLARKVEAFPPPFVAIVSGGNIDLTLLGHVVERGLTNAGAYLSFITSVKDRPGELYKLLTLLRERRINILEVEHRRAGVHVPLGIVEVELLVEAEDPDHGKRIIEDVRGAGYQVRTVL